MRTAFPWTCATRIARDSSAATSHRCHRLAVCTVLGGCTRACTGRYTGYWDVSNVGVAMWLSRLWGLLRAAKCCCVRVALFVCPASPTHQLLRLSNTPSMRRSDVVSETAIQNAKQEHREQKDTVRMLHCKDASFIQPPSFSMHPAYTPYQTKQAVN